jgi:hypothetical protein
MSPAAVTRHQDFDLVHFSQMIMHFPSLLILIICYPFAPVVERAKRNRFDRETPVLIGWSPTGKAVVFCEGGKNLLL